VPPVGRRQRHSEFDQTNDEDMKRMANDKSRPRAERLKAVAELKFRKVRNRQKRSK